ncbi:bifunctional DNA primase/polymerase [Mycobacterium colombiense]|nr:bifunctional DNA primase/polymerase [Mycobacterium colombiense]
MAILLPQPDTDEAPRPYSAYIETDEDGNEYVCFDGMETELLLSRAMPNLGNGWAPVLIGRLDPHRPNLPPHKTAWYGGYHGYGARTADRAELLRLIHGIAQRLASGRERGLLGYGLRTPRGVVGLDVDAHGGKRGVRTLAEHENRLGPLPQTYLVTARDPATGGGIRLYRTPTDWSGPGKLGTPDGGEGHVDLILPHLRYLGGPGSLHPTGTHYRLYGPHGDEITPGVLPPRDDLPALPDAWLFGLYRKPRHQGALATSAEVCAFADEYTYNEHPSHLTKTVLRVRLATAPGTTYPAYQRALYIAARKARAGCYPWRTARDAIEAAALAAYAERGDYLDSFEFARAAEHAITQALDLTAADVTAWGGWRATNE